MSIIVPNSTEVAILNAFIAPTLSMRLYSNNYTPVPGSTAAAFTQVTGGGYLAKPLTFANWLVVAGDPTNATYNVEQRWTFTGVTGAPGNIYGYYVIRVSDGVLQWAERFPAGNVPFVPINGSIIRVLPKFSAQSLF